MGTKPKMEKATKQEPHQDLVVFAIRISAADRDLIHQAAGRGKATEFARSTLIAAAKAALKR